MRTSDFTADQYEAAIVAAIGAGDFDAVESLIRGLAVVDPERAQLTLDTIQLGLSIAKKSRAKSAAGSYQEDTKS